MPRDNLFFGLCVSVAWWEGQKNKREGRGRGQRKGLTILSTFCLFPFYFPPLYCSGAEIENFYLKKKENTSLLLTTLFFYIPKKDFFFPPGRLKYTKSSEKRQKEKLQFKLKMNRERVVFEHNFFFLFGGVPLSFAPGPPLTRTFFSILVTCALKYEVTTPPTYTAQTRCMGGDRRKSSPPFLLLEQNRELVQNHAFLLGQCVGGYYL